MFGRRFFFFFVSFFFVFFSFVFFAEGVKYEEKPEDSTGPNP